VRGQYEVIYLSVGLPEINDIQTVFLSIDFLKSLGNRVNNMKMVDDAHSDKGLKAVLSLPQIYNLFSMITGNKSSLIRLGKDFVNPFPGCRILDIGCGTGTILSSFPNYIGEYNGFDMNESYIEFAKKRWKGNDKYRFFCERVSEATIKEKGHYDIVLATGILHHLNDREADDLLKIAHQSLKRNGVLITYDNVYVENQHWFAKWLISKDRGQSVRTVDGYNKLITRHFKTFDGDVVHDALNVPYTIYQTRCIKNDSAD